MCGCNMPKRSRRHAPGDWAIDVTRTSESLRKRQMYLILGHKLMIVAMVVTLAFEIFLLGYIIYGAVQPQPKAAPHYKVVSGPGSMYDEAKALRIDACRLGLVQVLGHLTPEQMASVTAKALNKAMDDCLIKQKVTI